MTELIPLTHEQFLAWKPVSVAAYALDKEREGLSREDALANAEKSFQDLLPENERTPDQFLYAVMDSGRRVGTLWWGARMNGSKRSAWIYNIEIEPEFRGKGFGRSTMELAQAEVKKAGITNLGLHVFGHNEIAQKLYRSLGFRTTNIIMQKELA